MRLPFVRPRASALFYLLVAVLASAPAWIVKHPPLQDMPIHLATIRIIKSFHDPAFGFQENFVLALGRTQYVLYYLVGALLAFLVGVDAANVTLLSLYLGGTVLAMRALLRALGRDERLSLFVVPLLVNTMFLYGLFPFLLGIPLMLWALARAVLHFERPTLSGGALLGTLALALFYSHVFPFGIFCIGFIAMFPWGRPSRWLPCGAPTLPALAAFVWWTFLTAAGRLARGAATDSGADPHRAMDAAILELPNWFTNVFRDTTDEVVIVALALLVVASLGLSLGDRDHAKRSARAYVVLPMACVVLYFVLPEAHGYIWLIAQRFPILFAITAIPLLRIPQGARGLAVTAAAVAVSAGSIVNTCKHFIRFEIDEVGDIDDAIDAMQPRRRVCALIYDRGSNIVNNQPFLHFGSYYQVEKGGVIMFTYAGYLHWPVDFQPDKYPPPGGAARMRWEWTPEAVPLGEIYPYYDYVLTRGPGFRPPAGTFRLAYRGEHWAVWAKP
ncbi:MAG: hypothetical protein M3O36_11965 [Myxococcota bacterium]|nr:hypothetical protein [Myxococcota bacterium]